MLVSVTRCIKYVYTITLEDENLRSMMHEKDVNLWSMMDEIVKCTKL